MWVALALIAGASLALAACSSGGGGKTGSTVTVTASSSASASSSSSSASASASPKPGKPVHVSLNIGDGGQVGVGMPIIATFKVKVRSAVAFQQATKVTVNNTPADGRWFFEYSDPASGHVMEAHYRLKDYWPAHAQIHMDLPVKGLSAGSGLTFDNSLTLDFSTGAANISTVDDSTHTITVTSDGKTWGKFPVSLGAANTPTARGVKVIMEKGASICMSGPGYHECGVKYTQRLTYGGEYLHAAPWNTAHIGNFDSSNGCTNLTTAAALKLYNFLEVGDVVTYPNANGPKMQLGQGYGDWNVPWSQWATGGAARTV
jgi:lipoprotein-anchoring transpeptidase ErfK/SrfK